MYPHICVFEPHCRMLEIVVTIHPIVSSPLRSLGIRISSHLHLYCPKFDDSKFLFHCLFKCADSVFKGALADPGVHRECEHWQSPKCSPTEPVTLLCKRPDTSSRRLGIWNRHHFCERRNDILNVKCDGVQRLQSRRAGASL